MVLQWVDGQGVCISTAFGHNYERRARGLSFGRRRVDVVVVLIGVVYNVTDHFAASARLPLTQSVSATLIFPELLSPYFSGGRAPFVVGQLLRWHQDGRGGDVWSGISKVYLPTLPLAGTHPVLPASSIIYPSLAWSPLLG